MCVRISLRWPLASLSLCLFIFLLAAKFYTLSLHDALPISLVAGHWSLAKAREPKTTNNQRPTTSNQLSSCRRHLCRLWRGARHGSHAPSGSGLRLGLRMGRRRESQHFSDLSIQLRQRVFIVFQELASILAALANAFALVAEP